MPKERYTHLHTPACLFDVAGVKRLLALPNQDINEIDIYDSSTALHAVAKSLTPTRPQNAPKQREIGKLLMDNGINPLLRDKYGRTALDCAKENNADPIFMSDLEIYTKQYEEAHPELHLAPHSLNHTTHPSVLRHRLTTASSSSSTTSTNNNSNQVQQAATNFTAAASFNSF